MIVNLKRCLSILLAIMLLIGIIPAAYAVESGADSTQPEKTVSEGTEPTDSIDPTEPTEPTEPPDIGIILAASEVPRIAQQFGLDSSVKVNMSSVIYSTNSAINLARNIMKPAAA